MSDRRFRRTERVLSARDFRRAYEGGKRLPSRSFTAFVVPNGLSHPRLGITATRKFGKAVERNRAKRLVRELYRHHKEIIPGGYDIIFNVRRQLLTSDPARLQDEFRELLHRINQQWSNS